MEAVFTYLREQSEENTVAVIGFGALGGYAHVSLARLWLPAWKRPKSARTCSLKERCYAGAPCPSTFRRWNSSRWRAEPRWA
jgi:hypothetical protein